MGFVEGLGWDWVEMKFGEKIEIEYLGKNPFAEAHQRVAFLHSQCPLLSQLMLSSTQHTIVEKEARKKKRSRLTLQSISIKIRKGETCIR